MASGKRSAELGDLARLQRTTKELADFASPTLLAAKAADKFGVNVAKAACCANKVRSLSVSKAGRGLRKAARDGAELLLAAERLPRPVGASGVTKAATKAEDGGGGGAAGATGGRRGVPLLLPLSAHAGTW